MPNTIEVCTFITKDMLRQVKNNLQFWRNCSGEDFAGRFTESPKKGETIKIRKQARFVGRDGETYSAESYVERTVEMTVQPTSGVDITLTNRELMFKLEQISERVVAPAAMTLANKIDRAALALAYASVSNCVGTPATIPNALKTYNQARAKLAWEGAPQDGRHVQLVTPDMQVEIADAIKGLNNPTKETEKAFRTGLLAHAYGADWYECQNLITHTVGPLGGDPVVAGADQTGATLNVSGWTAAAAARLKKGDIFTIAGCKAVNPWTRQSTGADRQFVVTANVASLADGTAAVPISPAIVTTGAYQNVTGSPANGTALTILGAAGAISPQGLRFHPDAFVVGSFDQPEPGGVDFVKTIRDPQTGLTIRFLRDWDSKANEQINRFDCVWAFGPAYTEFACRVAS